MTATLDPAVREVLLALADDELFMGHRHSEWLGLAPFLEEDLAHASIAQDELGHARALYGLLTDDVDALSFARSAAAYRSAWLVELPCRQWEDMLARHFFYDVAERVRWRNLEASTVSVAAELAAKALREEEYHIAHAVPLVQKLLTGTEQSHARVAGALQRLYPVARGLFEPTEGDSGSALTAGLSAAADLEQEWIDDVKSCLHAVGFSLAWDAAVEGYGGRRGRRSEHFAELHANMTAVYAIDPAAAW